MPRTSVYALASAATLTALIGGSLYFALGGRGPGALCGGAALEGESALIGGSFQLVDGSGRTVSDAEVLANPSLIYFGFTFCPDVCPFDLARNASAVDILAEKSVGVTPVFITVDPQRDTPEIVSEYAKAFHPEMIGLTGSPEQTAAAAKAYRVYFRKLDGDDEYYLMDHSTFTYLSIPGSGVVDYFRKSDSAEIVAERTSCQIGRFG